MVVFISYCVAFPILPSPHHLTPLLLKFLAFPSNNSYTRLSNKLSFLRYLFACPSPLPRTPLRHPLILKRPGKLSSPAIPYHHPAWITRQPGLMTLDRRGVPVQGHGREDYNQPSLFTTAFVALSNTILRVSGILDRVAGKPRTHTASVDIPSARRRAPPTTTLHQRRP
ncbi:hypothetical protein FA13DRAFT_624555 [Coprinellus micaceus]|uniref:Uncharacterized protein n=1 Tax=Coprinellus micaceus TaxID=71717 RepID=A0A4Y7T7Z5_COPMI|nr:hypothetical protein FA13DRAFT_624555 [Coprinellus micaceus]